MSVGSRAYCTCVLCCSAAADVFKLLEQAEHSKKKLEVMASYFELYLGKVSIHYYVYILKSVWVHTYIHCRCLTSWTRSLDCGFWRMLTTRSRLWGWRRSQSMSCLMSSDSSALETPAGNVYHSIMTSSWGTYKWSSHKLHAEFSVVYDCMYVLYYGQDFGNDISQPALLSLPCCLPDHPPQEVCILVMLPLCTSHWYRKKMSMYMYIHIQLKHKA